MYIDTTTGRGCALSIASKTVTRKLVADGIVGKVIAKKPRYNDCMLLRVVNYGNGWIYVDWYFTDEPEKQPLWVPSFIDAELWKRATDKFHIDERLDDNIAEYLLPQMEEYLQSLSDTDLVSMTRDFLIKHGIIDTPVSQRRGKTYYFNENEVYCVDGKSERFPYERRIRYGLFKVDCEPHFNGNVWSKAVSQFEVGMTLKECIGIFLQTKLTYHVPRELSPVDCLIQYIAPPVYERAPENGNESTFDYIRITVGLPRCRFDSWEALRKEVQKYRHEIYRRAVQRLKDDSRFRKYGVPVNCLRLSNATLLRDFSIELLFELKADISGELS